MKCPICKGGETQAGRTTLTLNRDSTTLVFKGVPAQVCANCGEAYLDEETTGRLLRAAEEAARAGMQLGIQEFAATSA